jgi:hypothetical protein
LGVIVKKAGKKSTFLKPVLKRRNYIIFPMAPANNLPPNPPRPFLAVGPVFILIFILGYALAYQLSGERARAEAHLSLAHLAYILQVKDDMGLIDWSKSLEKTDDFLACEIRAGGKPALTAGNAAFLPKGAIQGQSFQFPSQWGFAWKSPGASQEALLVFEAKPIPWFWGLTFAMGSVLFYFGLKFYFKRPAGNGITSSALPETRMKIPSPGPPRPTHSAVAASETRHPFLLVSKEPEILESSNSITGIFPFFQPGSTIFFDLEPSPELLGFIQKGKTGRVENAFKKAAGQSATIKTTEAGVLLVLEPSVEASHPQNH